MTDEELREMIRGAIARHLGSAPQDPGRDPGVNTDPGRDPGVNTDPGRDPGVNADRGGNPGVNFVAAPRTYASFGLLPLARGADGDGACLIEPAVRCNHCGYCLS